jgi:hypothetical protein
MKLGRHVSDLHHGFRHAIRILSSLYHVNGYHQSFSPCPARDPTARRRDERVSSSTSQGRVARSSLVDINRGVRELNAGYGALGNLGAVGAPNEYGFR